MEEALLADEAEECDARASVPSVGAASELSRSIGVRGVFLIGLFWVTGGFYGNESLVQLAPCGVVVGVVCVMPILFSVPVSLITAELSGELPASGGQAVFVEAAFGRFVGLQNACWVLLVVLADASIYPQLGEAYARRWCGGAAPCLVKVATIALTAAAHLGGTSATERASAVVSAVVLAPCVAFIALGLARTRGAVAAAGATETDAGLLLSWVLWNFSGWSSFGVIAGEVRKPVARNLLVGIAFLAPVAVALQALPVVAALSVEPDASRYEAGFFDHVARELGGAPLAVAFAVGAQCSNFGYHSSQMVSAQRTLYFVVEEHFGRRAKAAPASTSALGRFLYGAPKDGVRRVYVLACAAASLALSFVPWTALLQAEMSLYSVSKALFLASYLVLRWRRPKTTTPTTFRVPGGVVGAVAVAAGPFLVVGANLALTFFGDWINSAADGATGPFPGFHVALCLGLMAGVAAATAGGTAGIGPDPPPAPSIAYQSP